MEMKHIGVVLAVATVLAAILAFATSRGGARTAQAAQDGADAAKALFETKCSACHGLDRPLGTTKDKAGWAKTVKRMQQVNGCPITDEEAATIAGYLAKVRGAKGP